MATINQIQKALNKAMDLHPEVFFAGTTPSGNMTVWLVAGEHGNDYAVYEQGKGHCYEVNCTCKAGEHGLMCYHVQAVLLSKLERDAADAFNAALTASIISREEEEDALAIAVGSWWLDQQAKAQKAAPATYREMCFVCNHYMQFDGVGMPLCSEKCRKEHAWHNERQREKATAPIESGFDLRNVLAFQSDVA